MPIPGPEVLRAGCELLILPDGSIMAHNLTPALAAVLQAVFPKEESLKLRLAGAQIAADSQLPSI